MTPREVGNLKREVAGFKYFAYVFLSHKMVFGLTRGLAMFYSYAKFTS